MTSELGCHGRHISRLSSQLKTQSQQGNGTGLNCSHSRMIRVGFRGMHYAPLLNKEEVTTLPQHCLLRSSPLHLSQQLCLVGLGLGLTVESLALCRQCIVQPHELASALYSMSAEFHACKIWQTCIRSFEEGTWAFLTLKSSPCPIQARNTWASWRREEGDTGS